MCVLSAWCYTRGNLYLTVLFTYISYLIISPSSHQMCSTLHTNLSFYPRIVVHLHIICTGHNTASVTTSTVDHTVYITITLYSAASQIYYLYLIYARHTVLYFTPLTFIFTYFHFILLKMFLKRQWMSIIQTQSANSNLLKWSSFSNKQG